MQIGLLGTVRTINPAVRPEIGAGLPPGIELSAWPSRIGAFPATPVEMAMQAIGHLEAGLSAAEAGAHAAVIDSVADYGIDALRAALAIPVVGSGEAGLTAAAGHGRFTIITVWPKSMNFVTEQLLRQHGLEAQCLGIHNVAEEGVLDAIAGPDGYLNRINRADRSVFDKVLAAVNRAIEEGAQAIMLGCTCMSGIAAKIAANTSIPVINPLWEAAKMAVALAHSSDSTGVKTDRADLVRRMVNAVAGEVDENCPVCVAAEEFD